MEGGKMKKVGLLLAVIIGLAPLAFAQFDARGAYKLGEAIDQRQREKQAEDERFIKQIKEKGTLGPISYCWEGVRNASFEATPEPNVKKCYSKNGKIYGYEYHGDDNRVYILLSRSDWQAMYDEIMPNWVSRHAVYTIWHHILKTDTKTYKLLAEGADLLPHQEYRGEDGKRWMLIKCYK